MSLLIEHENPEAREHHNTGPHVGCNCRVCVLQRKVVELALKIEDMHYELLEAGEMNDL
jgi:hypothetical protein